MASKVLSYPNHFTLACFSELSYENQEESKAPRSVNKELEKYVFSTLSKWNVLKVFDKPECGNYYGVIFENIEEKQIVLAHRGVSIRTSAQDCTEEPLPGSYTLDKYLSIISEGLAGNREEAAYEATKFAVEAAKTNEFTLTLTGHSLGAYLSEISILSCHQRLEYYRAKAVTFESPGSKRKLKAMKLNIETTGTKIS